ncbi:hypothetical protein ACH4UM_12480 [Streptomyces sp. NPDC020801]|uniref:hypothetical protein n=1 Tax=unclassified Streptomyces TaxID=2593676 RepID=UPI0037A06215
MTAPAAALLGTAAALAAGPTAHARPAGPGDGGAPGAETLGDPVFPALGNDGYRVTAHHLDLSYDPTTRLVDATATLALRTTRCLTRLSLDALGLDVRAVRVAGRTASFEQADEKLRITPDRALPDDTWATVCVEYVEYSADPGRTLAHTGWVPAPDGFAVCGRPNSAHTVFPCNDHPSDKADFTFRRTVPAGLLGVANGLLVRTEHLDGDGASWCCTRSRSSSARTSSTPSSAPSSPGTATARRRRRTTSPWPPRSVARTCPASCGSGCTAPGPRGCPVTRTGRCPPVNTSPAAPHARGDGHRHENSATL